MSAETTREMMMAYGEALLARGRYDEYFSEDVVVSLMAYSREVAGRKAARQFIDYFHDQAFEADIELKSVVCSEDKAHIEAVFVARHTGEFEGIPATGRQVSVPYSVGYDVSGGKITALRIYFPIDVLVRQIQAEGATAQ